jgi:hypothetical protein
VPEVRVGFVGPLFPTGNGMVLSHVPNSWGGANLAGSRESFGGNTPGATDGHDRRWVFVLDNAPPQPNDYSPMNATQYNAFLGLGIENQAQPILIDPTGVSLTANLRIPLSGRLSGNWVIDGAADQGFVISISELVPDAVSEPDKTNGYRVEPGMTIPFKAAAEPPP